MAGVILPWRPLGAENRKINHMAKTAEDLPGIEGPGVGRVKDKMLDRLGGEIDDLREKRADLSEDITNVEKQIVARMKEKKLTVYFFGDREMRITPGTDHIKTKQRKDGKPEEEEEEEKK